MNPDSSPADCERDPHIPPHPRARGEPPCAHVYAWTRAPTLELCPENVIRCTLNDLPVSEGRVRSDENDKKKNPPWPGLCPPRGPCESLPCAALWGNILRVLYLHDNTIPKNQLWRNGRKPGEVIGCRLGQGEGSGPCESAGRGRGLWRGEERRGVGRGAKCCCSNIKQAARSNITVSSVSDLLDPTPGSGLKGHAELLRKRARWKGSSAGRTSTGT